MMTWQTKIIIYPLNGYQFWQGRYIQQVASFDHVVLQGQVNYFSSSFTTTKRPMTPKLGKMVAYYKKLQSIKSHNPLNTWSREVTWLPNLAGWLDWMLDYNQEISSIKSGLFYYLV